MARQNLTKIEILSLFEELHTATRKMANYENLGATKDEHYKYIDDIKTRVSWVCDMLERRMCYKTNWDKEDEFKEQQAAGNEI